MRQLMVRHVPEHRPTPTVAPVMHCVVEMGSSARLLAKHVDCDVEDDDEPR
jgi:hypothetical protein